MREIHARIVREGGDPTRFEAWLHSRSYRFALIAVAVGGALVLALEIAEWMVGHPI
jgi:hypothetical protein